MEDLFSELELYVLSSYEYLDYLHNYVEDLDKIYTSKIISKIIKNSLKEKEIQSQFLSNKILDNTVSQAVSSMYEENRILDEVAEALIKIILR